MYSYMQRNINKINNVKNILLKKEWTINSHMVNDTIERNEMFLCNNDNSFIPFKQSFINIFNKKQIIYEMRRDRGGTVRRKLSREKKKTQKKQKKESTDVHK
ncbi:conserved Plasmodium protein, unknown function [Plasmodium sp. gorilla clade G2]|uniref:conserved Plasmodium protein, unknown function n=1 Tax=Plasmodium sp. gorilla clade G2 TaxID=880535 RepID=UPI000D210AC4|nr:conserved Plasmodium protein, unknown function [Plasmodium sp. gorilla clade G2]SOV11227.1 conserved Plasmodium protein, unknown function [Plasmodium sp. gorilla clade G2]